MSATRANLAAAVSSVGSVEGLKIKGHEKRPTSEGPGDSWAIIGGYIPGRGRTVAVQWRLIVILGQDEIRAEKVFAELFWPVADAVRPLAVVDSAAAFMYPTEAGESYAAEFILRSE